jgi:signal transduction histidine kinase
LVSLLLAHRLVKPVRALNLAAQELAAGASTLSLPVESNDEIGQLTRTFNEMASALSRHKQLRQQMLADIAHELRTPLSIMQLEVEGLNDLLQSPTEAAASLRDELNTLNRLVEDLRLLSLIEAGSLNLELNPLDPAAFLQQVVETWQPKAQAQRVRLAAEVAANLPLIEADRERLRQVFNNLLSNALRHTPAEKSIIVGGRQEAAELLFWVVDGGPGIPAAHLPYIFDRFYQVDPTPDRAKSGGGLGLAITKQWVGLHGGRIWAENELGGGAAFYVALPLGGI